MHVTCALPACMHMCTHKGKAHANKNEQKCKIMFLKSKNKCSHGLVDPRTRRGVSSDIQNSEEIEAPDTQTKRSSATICRVVS